MGYKKSRCKTQATPVPLILAEPKIAAYDIRWFELWKIWEKFKENLAFQWKLKVQFSSR
jgi:hypothetical protein